MVPEVAEGVLVRVDFGGDGVVADDVVALLLVAKVLRNSLALGLGPAQSHTHTHTHGFTFEFAANSILTVIRFCDFFQLPEFQTYQFILIHFTCLNDTGILLSSFPDTSDGQKSGFLSKAIFRLS